MVDRTNRESQTREKKARVESWKPPSALDAPEPPVGYVHRWIRESFMDFDDTTIDEGKNAGVIGVGGLLLARIPEEIVAQRKQYYENVTANQMEAVDSDWMRDSNPNMPKLKPQRQSNVTFGNKKPN